jgi:hypothetical protein
VASQSLTPSWAVNGWSAGGGYGSSVATAGDVNADGYSDILVGAPNDVGGGHVLLYLGSPAGPVATSWTPGGFDPGSLFGASVACAGDVNGDGYDDVIIGDPGAWNNPPPDDLCNGGQAYVYYGSAAGLPASPSVRLVGCNYASGANLDFGRAVSGAGDMDKDGYDEVAVGAPGFSITGTFMVFRGSSGGPLTGTALTPYSVAFGGGRLGRSLALGGDMDGDGYSDLIVGAPGSYPVNTNKIGRCVVYFGGPGVLSYASRSTEIGSGFSQVNDGFGFAVASVGDIDGDGYLELLVGAPGRKAGPDVVGRAMMFHGSSTGPTQVVNWQMDGEIGEGLGYSVTTAGDGDGDGFAEWAVGAPDNQNSGRRPSGRVLMAHYDVWGGTYSASYFYGEDTARLGASLGSAGDVDGDGYGDLIVGGPSFDALASAEPTGHAELHRGGSATIGTAPAWSQTGGCCNFGQSLSGAGDVNGDGFADLLIAYPDWNGQGYFGLYLCHQNGPTSSPDLRVDGSPAFGMQLGRCIASAGDINRDGYDDIIVGAPGSGTDYQGRAFAWYGSADGITSATPDWTRNGVNPEETFGYWVAGAGDVNGDGFADVLVSSTGGINGPIVHGGRVDLFLGSFSGLGTTPQRSWFGDEQSEQYGYSAAGAGDVNGDGYDDIVIGTPLYNCPFLTHAGPDTLRGAGRADVYFGGPNGPATIPSWSRFGEVVNSYFGFSVDGAGDLNGDGISDVAIGDMGYNNSDGRVQIILGSTSGVPNNQALLIPSPLVGAQFGTTVSSVGDVDGDGYGDLGVTAPSGYIGSPDWHEAYAFVYRGGPTGLAAEPPTQIDTGQIFRDSRRMPIAAAGDVNGDSFDDVLVGNPGTTMAILFAGNGKYGQNRHFHQENAGGGNVAAHAALSTNQFRIGASVRTPWGREKVRLQWELETVGVPFDGLGLVKGSTITLSSVVPGLGSSSEAVTGPIVAGPIGGPPAHWRARIISRSPFFPRSPWFSMGADLEDDYDVRPSHGVVAVEPPVASIGRLALEGGRPNPFVATTALRFTLTSAGQIELRILDVKGRLVRRIESGTLIAGAYTRSWDGLDTAGFSSPAGVYFAELATVEGKN